MLRWRELDSVGADIDSGVSRGEFVASQQALDDNVAIEVEQVFLVVSHGGGAFLGVAGPLGATGRGIVTARGVARKSQAVAAGAPDVSDCLAPSALAVRVFSQRQRVGIAAPALALAQPAAARPTDAIRVD